MDLSIVIPSIRTYNWYELLSSIKSSCKNYSYEVIFVGPEKAEEQLPNNVKFIRDFGSPNRCQQLGMIMSEGTVVTWGSDDCMYTPNSIDKCLKPILDDKTHQVVITNYTEAGSQAVENFNINKCYPKCKNVRDEWVIFNTAFMLGGVFDYSGGFDCSFDVTCVGHADLAARVQALGWVPEVLNINLLSCSHMPNTTGDHAPVHYAQLTKDIPNYLTKWNNDFPPQYRIDKDNWKSSETVWSRRWQTSV